MIHRISGLIIPESESECNALRYPGSCSQCFFLYSWEKENGSHEGDCLLRVSDEILDAEINIVEEDLEDLNTIGEILNSHQTNAENIFIPMERSRINAAQKYCNEQMDKIKKKYNL